MFIEHKKTTPRLSCVKVRAGFGKVKRLTPSGGQFCIILYRTQRAASVGHTVLSHKHFYILIISYFTVYLIIYCKDSKSNFLFSSLSCKQLIDNSLGYIFDLTFQTSCCNVFLPPDGAIYSVLLEPFTAL